MRRVLMVSVGVLAAAWVSACQKKPAEVARSGEAMSVAVAPGGASAPTAPGGLPKRKLGVWSQTVSVGGRDQVSRICLDEAMDARLSAWGQAMGDGGCSKNLVTPFAGG